MKKNEKMNCCVCETTVDLNDTQPPAKWFGLYRWNEIVRVICKGCITKPENKNWWK